VIRDASADLHFAGDPLVTGEPHIRFYAGIPLQTPDGYNIGTFCVADAEPRGCTDQQLRFLKELSRLVLLQLEARLLRLDEEAAHRKAMVRTFTGSSDSDSCDRSQSAPLLAAAHHIRTPLNGIFAAADLLALTELTPEQREYLEIVRTSSRNLLNLAAEALKQFEGTQPIPPAADQRLQDKNFIA
jgi:signal transduction histidine kinase